MADPILTESWFSRGEVPFPETTDVLAAQRSWMWLLKALLKDEVATGSTKGTRVASMNWTCEGSSDGTTAGMDGSDRWGGTYDNTKLVRNTGGSAHSWIVLKSNTAFGNGAAVYLLISYKSGSNGNIVLTFSRNAYTGGSTTVDPTSTNETGIGTSSVGSEVSVMGVESSFGVAYYAQIAIGPGGEFHFATNRVSTGQFNSYLSLLDHRNITAGDLWPTVALFHATTSTRGAGTIASIISPSGGYNTRTWGASARQSGGGPATWTFGSTSFSASGKDLLKNKWTTLPILANNCTDTLQTGWRGELEDVWWVSGATVGAGYPLGDGTQTQMVVGDLLVPFGVPAAL